jgi:hypothetical protein
MQESIVRKLLGPLALKNIYCTYLKFFAGRLAELPHTLHALYLAVGKEKERQAKVKEV